MSKPRSDSWLRTLTQERQDQVIEWCLQPADRDTETGKAVPKTGGYHYARAQLAADGISVSVATLSDFYSWYQLRRTFERADHKTQDFEELLRKEFPTADAGKIQKVGQDYFTLQAMAASNAEEFREMEKLRLAKETAATKGRQEEKKLELAERRVALLEENASKAKEKLEKVISASKGGLTKDTLRQIEEAAKLL